MRKPCTVGIDIGGTKTLCLLVSDRFQVVAEEKFKSAPEKGRDAFTKSLLGAMRKLSRRSQDEGLEIKAVGVAAAGSIDEEKGRILHSPNLLPLEDYPIGRILREAQSAEVIVGHDVQLGVYGEYRLGAAKGKSHVMGVFFGTGVGGGAVINGRIYRGASGFGGQVGCLLAQPVGGPKAAMSHGIIDRIASKAAIAGEALVMAVKNWAPYLHRKVGSDLSKVTWGLIRRAIEKGDVQIEEMLRARMRVVGIALSDAVNFMNPDMLVLGGGLVDEMPKLIVGALESGLREYLVPEVNEALKVKAAELGGEAVALGAAHAAHERTIGLCP